MQLAEITEEEGTFFSVKANTVRPYEYYDDVHISVAYEFDLNLYRIDREAYNLLDWLGDLGGLKEALMIIFAFIYGLFNQDTFDNFLVSKLFRSATSRDRMNTNLPADDPEATFHSKHEGKKLDPSRINCIIQRLHDCGFCLRGKTTNERLLAKGR